MRLFIIFILFSLCGCSTTAINISGEKPFPFIKTQNKPSPTVLIAHGCDGWNNGNYYQWVFDFYKLGYNAILVDSFEFRGYKNLCNRGAIVSPSTRANDFEAVSIWAKSQPWHKGGVAVVGFSHGGSTALNIANNSRIKNIDAVVSYYPGCISSFVGENIYNPKIPAQVHLADKDDWTLVSHCGEMKKYEVYHYPNATHGFDLPAPKRNYFGYNLEYDEEATSVSKKRVEEFLKRTLNIKE